LSGDRLPAPDHRESIENTVYGLLDRVPEFIWDGESLPVPVEQIVSNSFGLLIRLVEDMTRAPGLAAERSENVSGLLLVADGEIWVNAAEARQWEGRKRFTIGHELGHYVMHQERARPTIFCRKVEVEEDLEGAGRVSIPVEREADAFAAAMLMPEHLVREHVEINGIDVPSLCTAFGTSEKATRYRVEVLFGPDPRAR
jgi:hypothetical protein